MQCNLRQIIQDTVELCREKFTYERIIISISCADEVLIKARETEISQVLMNLFNNSYDAVENLSERWVEIKVTSSDEKLEMKFIDSGKGISSKIAEQMYNPFFTTKEVGKGTGLGLSISKQIISRTMELLAI